MNNEISNEDLLSNVRARLGVDKGGLKYPTYVAPPSFKPGTNDLDDKSALTRRARFIASGEMLFKTDLSTLDDTGASALYEVVTEGMFGLKDSDGQMAFGKRAKKNPRENLEMLRRFVKGEYNLIEDPEYTKWREMDEEGKFQYALEKETTSNKLKSHIKGERGASLAEQANAVASVGPKVMGPDAIIADFFTPKKEKERKEHVFHEAARRSNYDTLNDEEKASYRADVIGDYEKKLSRRQTLATYLQFASNLSDKAAYLLAESFQKGTPDINVEFLNPEERDRVYSAFSLMRGDKKRGRILGIETDFTDDTAANRFQMGLYGLQQSVVGLVTDTGDMMRAGALRAYAQVMLDDAERKAFFEGWDATVRAERAMEQPLPEASSGWGDAFQGLMENVHWFIPYGVIGKGGKIAAGATKTVNKAKLTTETLKGMRTASEIKAAAAKTRWLDEFQGAVNAGRKIDDLSSVIAWKNQVAAIEKYTKALQNVAKVEKSAKMARIGGRSLWTVGEASALSAFSSEYIAAADAAGISREESVITAFAIGLINAQVERLYVAGLESSLTPAQVKALTFKALYNAVKSDGAAGFRKWFANRVQRGVVEGAKVTVTEGMIEEPLQQLATEHGIAFDKICQELRAEGKADVADQFVAFWQSFAKQLPKDYGIFIDTVCDSMPTSLAFGVTTVGNAVRKQHLHNAWTRHQNRRAGSTHTMLGATSPEELRTAIDYDAGLVDLIQQGINTQLAVEKHWKGDKSDEAKNPHRFVEALTAARRAYRKAQTRDVVQEVAEAAGVDVKTAEIITQYLQTEAESIAFSPQARAFSSLRMSLADIDETTIKTVLPGYIEGSYAADEENGIYSGRVKLGDGTERTIAYRVGDLSEMLREQVEENSKIDSSYGVSFDERQKELGTGITWASLSDAQRYQYALTLSNGISTGRGVFELTDAKGEKVRVNADDVIYLANGRLGDIGYGTAASMGTARHETFHSLWRFARATLDEEDVQSLAKALGVDVTANGWENKLDERMAHQLEMYASGHYVSHAVSSRFDKMLDGWAGKVIKFFGSLGPADEVRDPKTGKSFALKNFYDAVLRGELGSGKLGVEIRNIPAAPAVQPGATDVKAGTIPVEVTDEERAAAEAETRKAATETEKPVLETEQPVSGTEKPVSGTSEGKIVYTAENPADASVPNQRYYIIGLPNSDIKLVGRLEVRDAHTGLTTSTDEDYHDRGNQNRDDKSEESRALVNKIAAHPDPLQIGTVQPIANNGIVWALPNGDVIIGNHRVNGVRVGYEKGTAGELEKFVREDAAKRGIEIGEGVKAPLTVFILEKIDAPEGVKADVHEVVRLANESQNRGFNIREQAGNDAKILIDNNLLPRMAFRPDGRIDETKSADAIGKFRQESGAQGMVGEDGMLTEEGQTRLQNAAVAALLAGTGNNALLGRIMDNAGRLDMASQLRALMKVTPELMSLAKTKPQFDIRDALADALMLYTEWREKDEEKRSEKGKSKHDWRELDKEGKRKRGLSWEAFMSQGDMFRTPSEEAKILGDLFARTESLRSFDREDVESAAGKKRVVDLIADYLTDYIENARNVNTETVDMFGSAPASRAEVLAAQRAKGESGARFSIAAQREYDDVVSRFTKADGTKKPGWMKAPNGKPSKLTERQWVLVRTPSFKKWFGDWEATAEINSFDLNAAKEKLQDLIRRQEEVLTADGMKLLFRGQAKKAWSKEAERESDNSAAHWAAVGNIDELCRRAVQLWEEKPRNGSTDIRAYVKYGTVFTFGGERYIAKITTKAYPEQESQNFYSVESVAVEKIIAHGIHKTITKGQSLDVSDEGKISNLIDSVNSVSKVVDENGEPMVVAHSTDASFTIFRDMQKNDAGWLGAGFYFFGDRSLDGQYGDNVMECFLNVRNPYYLSPSEHVELAGADSAAHSREFSENLRADGYDGVYFNGDGNSEYAVFSPTQIKSATDNTGAFDGTNADIRFSIGGIFTGSAADYEKPSLHAVGKSNGVAFGWGLYGSSAKSDAVNFGDNIYEQTFFTNRPDGDESHLIEWDKPLSEENKNRILDGLVYQARKNEAVKNAVESTLADEARDFGLDQDEDYVPESVEGMPDDVLREAIERTIDVQTDNGRSVYTHLAALLTGKSIGEVNSFAGRLDAFKAASEFLRDECDIDGIKYPAEADGAKHGETHYVSFRDDNIRVDHKWTDGQQRFSMSAELLEAMGEKAFKSQYGIGSAARNGEGFVDLERGDTFDGIEDYLKLRVKEEVENTILGISATIGSKGNANELARHTASGEDLESHKFAAKNALMLFKKSKTGMVHHDEKGTGKDYIRVFAPFYFNGEIYLATITLRRDKDSDKIYSIESVLTKKDAVSGVPRGKTAPFQNAASQDSGDSPRSSRRTAQEAQSPESLKTGDSPRSSRRTAQEAQSPVSLEERISYYLGNVNETEPKFVNSGENFSQEELIRRIRADISALQGPMYSIAPDMTGGIFPEISRMSDDELVTAAVAVRMALGETGKFSDRAVKVNTVNKIIRRLHPEYKSTDVGRESLRVISDARKFAKKIREDLDRGVSDSLILEHLPKTAREQFGREMVEEARKGQRLGRFGQKVTDKLEDRQARIVEDAVRIQTGMDVSLMENLYGINLSETLMHLAENPLTEKPPQSAGAGEGESVQAEESAGEEAEPIDVSAAVKAAVDEIVGAAKTATDANERNRADRRAAAGRDAERAAELGGEEPGAEGGAGDDFGGEDIVAIATKKAKVNLENPRHLAEFVAELTRRYWIKEHELGQNAEVWRDLVAVQFLRKTAQGIYAKLCKDLTYSRSRETAMQRIAKFDHAATVQGLLTQMTFVGALINSQRIRDTQKALCEKLDLFLRQKFGAQGRFKPDKEEGKRNVSAEAELRARYMRHAMWLTPDAAAEEARELQEKLDLLAVEFTNAGRDRDQSREFVETIRKLNVLREFGALRYKPVGEIEAAAKWWEDFERGESDDIVREMSDRDIRTKKAAELLAKAFADPKRVTVREGTSTADRLNKALTGHLGFISIIKDCMRHASDADREAVKDIVGWLELEIQKAGDGTATEKRHHNDAFHAAVESIYAKSFNKVMKEMMVRDDRFLKFMGEVGGKRDIPTKGRAMQLLVSLLQEGRKVEVEDEENPGKKKIIYEGGYHDNIVKHKREGQAAELMKLMSPADMNMIKWLGMWYEQNRQDLSRVCHSLFGIGVYAELPNYFPVKMRLDKQGLEKGAAVGWTIFPKALTPRVKNERDFDTSADIFQMWSSRMEEGSQWKHHAQLGLEMRGIFGRAELQGAVISNHGEATNALMQGFITDVLAGKGAVDRSTGDVQYVSDKIRGWTALCALGGNVGVMLKQLTSIPAFGFEIGLIKTASHVITAFTPEGISAMVKIWNSEQRKTRWDVGYSEAVANALREDRPSKPINDIGGILQRAGNGSKEAIGLLKRMLQASMITNKIGDVVPALIVGQGIYRDCIAQGMSETDAMAKTWMIVERTQQSSRMENLASIQRRNVIGRMMYQFLSTQRQYLDYELRAIREVIAQPTSVKRWKKLGTTTILNHFILTTLYWGVGQLYKAMLGQEPPEDQLTDAVISCLMGPNGSLFVVGFCCNETLQRAMKGNYYGSGTTMLPMESWIKTQIGDGIGLTHAIFDREGDTWDNILDATSEWLSDFNSTFRDLRKIYRFRIKGEEQKKRK